MRVPCLFVLLAGCGGARAAAPINTGDPLPSAGAEPAVCRPAGGFRWLGSDPHVPFAVSGPDGVASAGENTECCAAWAREGDAWTAIDAWGAPVGDATVAGGEGYDVSQCYELVLEPEPAAPAILVRGDEAWTAPPSARWEPDEAQRAAALELGASIDRIYAPQSPAEGFEAARPLEERTMFFTAPDGARFAAVGGRAIAILGVDDTGAWKLQYLDGSWSLADSWIGETYRVLAVVDMDRDGFPEVVFHRTEGPAWDQVALRASQDSTLRTWEQSAVSIGGATL